MSIYMIIKYKTINGLAHQLKNYSFIINNRGTMANYGFPIINATYLNKRILVNV